MNITELIEQNRIKSNRIEYKQGWNPAAIYHTICAFANDFENFMVAKTNNQVGK